mmetsp:Transcript_406/g.1150  ORF Transcript_406/g.1150 Transcript_406/m.1150 type:complete len:210 (+) Transcript_406:880-1509(+)
MKSLGQCQMKETRTMLSSAANRPTPPVWTPRRRRRRRRTKWGRTMRHHPSCHRECRRYHRGRQRRSRRRPWPPAPNPPLPPRQTTVMTMRWGHRRRPARGGRNPQNPLTTMAGRWRTLRRTWMTSTRSQHVCSLGLPPPVSRPSPPPPRVEATTTWAKTQTQRTSTKSLRLLVKPAPPMAEAGYQWTSSLPPESSERTRAPRTSTRCQR